MAKAKADVSAIKTYHAHVYFDAESKRKASALRAKAKKNLSDIKIGRWHHEPVGPHPCPMYLFWFTAERFAEVVPWLALNRNGLSILVHPQLDQDVVADHTDHAMWLGKPLKLRLHKFTGKPPEKRGF